MQPILDALNNFFAGISRSFTFEGMFIIGIVLSVPMTIFFVGEIFSYQFVLRPPWFAKIRRRWTAKALVVMAMTAALSIVLQVAGSPGVLIPGTITFRLDATVRFAFGAIFGMPAAWGTMIANPIGDALTGTWGPGSIAGFVISWWEAYLFYRFFDRPDDYAMKTAGSWAKYYLVAFLWCLLGAYYLCTNFKYLNLLPDEVIWPGVFPAVIVTTFIGGLLGPVVARIVGPAAQRYGLARDEIGYERPGEAQQASGRGGV